MKVARDAIAGRKEAFVRIPSWLWTCSLAAALAACRTGPAVPDAAPRPAAASPGAPAAGAQASDLPRAQPAPAATPAPEKPVDVSLRVEAVTRRGHGFIESDETLRSGDRMALHVAVSEPAYVYVGLASSNGSRSVIHPKGEPELLATGTDLRVPPGSQWLKLDKTTGQEDLFVYASRRVLTKAQLAALLEADGKRARRASAPRAAPASGAGARRPAPPADDSPDALSPATRGLEVVGDSGSELATEGGITKAHFTVQHR